MEEESCEAEAVGVRGQERRSDGVRMLIMKDKGKRRWETGSNLKNVEIFQVQQLGKRTCISRWMYNCIEL